MKCVSLSTYDLCNCHVATPACFSAIILTSFWQISLRFSFFILGPCALQLLVPFLIIQLPSPTVLKHLQFILKVKKKVTYPLILSIFSPSIPKPLP